MGAACSGLPRVGADVDLRGDSCRRRAGVRPGRRDPRRRPGALPVDAASGQHARVPARRGCAGTHRLRGGDRPQRRSFLVFGVLLSRRPRSMPLSSKPTESATARASAQWTPGARRASDCCGGRSCCRSSAQARSWPASLSWWSTPAFRPTRVCRTVCGTDGLQSLRCSASCCPGACGAEI